eukprot:337675_1
MLHDQCEWVSGLRPIAFDNNGKLKSFELFMSELQSHHDLFSDRYPMLYIKFRIQTQRNFYEELQLLHADIDSNQIKYCQQTAQLLCKHWVRGAYLMIIHNGNTDMIPSNEFVGSNKQFIIAQTNKLLLWWLPLHAIRLFLIDMYGFQLVANTHFDKYLSELGFYVFLVTKDPNNSQMTIISNRYVIAPSKLLNKKLKHFFNKLYNRKNKFSLRRFQKIIGNELLYKIIKYECRAILLQKLKDEYSNECEVINATEHVIVSYPITDLTVNKKLLSEFVYHSFMHTFHELKCQKKDNCECIMKIQIHGIFRTLFRVTKDKFYEFIVKSNQCSMIQMQYMFMCWIKQKLRRMKLHLIGYPGMEDYWCEWRTMVDMIFEKQAKFSLLERKLVNNIRCNFCGVRKNDPKLKVIQRKLRLCKGCKITFYCCRKHQKKGWKSHKQYCYRY